MPWTPGPSGLLRLATAIALSLALWPGSAASTEPAADLAAEIARLRGRLADSGAQEQHCLAGAVQPVWTAELATDLKALRDRANRAATEGATAEAERWKELARKAEALQARVTMNARTGAELFQSQQIGLDCLDRHVEEREALRASLEVAVTDPAAYGESLRLAREDGGATLSQDLAALQEQSRALSTRWRQTHAGSSADSGVLKANITMLKRRHTAALESATTRALADPVLRAAEALLAAAAAWERERGAEARAVRAREDAERGAANRERDEAGRLARGYWATADRLMERRVTSGAPTRTGTTSPGAGGTP